MLYLHHEICIKSMKMSSLSNKIMSHQKVTMSTIAVLANLVDGQVAQRS